jgi:hypothetical protein
MPAHDNDSAPHAFWLYLAGALAAVGLAAGCAMAEPRIFSFRSIEFMQAERRQPAAETFVADHIKPGMATADALVLLRQTGLSCRPKKRAADTTECVVVSLEHNPDSDLHEIWWTVDVVSTPGGTVASATVNRSQYGL